MKANHGELSFNVIIVAIISLIVLVVVIAIFSGKSSSINDNVDACMGQCISEAQCMQQGGQVNPLSKNWCENNEAPGTVCCITLPSANQKTS